MFITILLSALYLEKLFFVIVFIAFLLNTFMKLLPAKLVSYRA